MLTESFVPLLHTACVWAMTGIIWLVQLVHYPLFAFVPAEHFAAFHTAHCQRITWVVGPLMVTELVSGLLAAWSRPSFLWAACAGLSLSTFALTAWLSVPLHARLGLGWDAATHARLVSSNGWRTAAWTLHALLLAWAQVSREGAARVG